MFLKQNVSQSGILVLQIRAELVFVEKSDLIFSGNLTNPFLLTIDILGSKFFIEDLTTF